MSNPSHYVIFDSNIWVAERLLQSSIGSAALYAIASANAQVGLPEVVEIETNQVLRNLAEKAVTALSREVSLLQHVSGHRMVITAPSAVAIEDGLTKRWQQLDGVLQRVPFSHDHAKSALHRVIKKGPPSGENNEQFRDCCIWEAALGLAKSSEVHLVTSDNAFYEGRDRSRGLASPLRQELAAKGCKIYLHATLRDFLTAVDKTAASIDEPSIKRAIVEAVQPQAIEIAQKDKFELGELRRATIAGYATPKPSLVAVSFETAFTLKRVAAAGDGERESEGSLRIAGVCSYEPASNAVSDIELREWFIREDRAQGGFWGHSGGQFDLWKRQYEPGNFRVIS